jgi:hypothetical protein
MRYSHTCGEARARLMTEQPLAEAEWPLAERSTAGHAVVIESSEC